jgi:predicted dehydrogenase
MAQKYRLGICSLEHDHVWGEIAHWQNLPNVEVVAVGDSDARLLAKARSLGLENTYSSWRELLENERVDIVQAASDNATGADIVELAMSKGAHVVSEKPMAATLDQANRMVAAARKNDRRLMINWPHIWDPAYQEWERLIMGGSIGRLLHLKRRNAHNGPMEIGCDPAFYGWLYDAERNGAGALMDYCGYGADIAANLLGLPQSVVGIRAVLAKEYTVPDDNAIILMQYAGAFAQTEASWTEITHAPGPYTIAYGTTGVCSFSDGEVTVGRSGNQVEKITPPPLKSPKSNGPEYFLHCLHTGEPIEGCASMEVSRNAQEILEAGLRSSNTGRRVDLPL